MGDWMNTSPWYPRRLSANTFQSSGHKEKEACGDEERYQQEKNTIIAIVPINNHHYWEHHLIQFDATITY